MFPAPKNHMIVAVLVECSDNHPEKQRATGYLDTLENHYVKELRTALMKKGVLMWDCGQKKHRLSSAGERILKEAIEGGMKFPDFEQPVAPV